MWGNRSCFTPPGYRQDDGNMGLDLVPFIDSPFRTKVELAKYAALPVEERLTHASILGDKLGMAVKKAWLRDDEKMGGMSSEIKFLEVELTSGERLALVLKYAAGNPRRAALGNARDDQNRTQYDHDRGQPANPTKDA